MRSVLILELSAAGHHARYLRWIIESLASPQGRIVVAAPLELLGHPELAGVKNQFESHELQLSAKEHETVDKLSSFGDLVVRQFAVRAIWKRVFLQVCRTVAVDRVILPWADDCMDAIGILGSPFLNTQWAGIVFRPMFHFRHIGVKAPRQRFSAFRKFLFRRALRNPHLAGMLTIDPTLMEFSESQWQPQEQRKLRFLPDPTLRHELRPREAARQMLAIPPHAKLVVAYGALDERKGIAALVEAAVDAACPKDVHVLLAGRHSDFARSLLSSSAGAALRAQNRLHSLDAYITDDEEAMILSAADAIWIGYRGFYTMSGILVLAARHGIPAIVSEAGLAGYLTRKHNCGVLVDPDDHRTIVAALGSLPTAREAWSLAGHPTKAFDRHSVPEFKRVISELVDVSLTGSREKASLSPIALKN